VRKRAGASGGGPKAFDVWETPPELPAVRPVTPATDPTSLLRSLGDPPLAARGLPVDEYLFRAVIKASQLATGVAAAASLYAPSDDDD
jgi:hypothetical protein